MKSETIYFICGALRSGSTLLHLMIDHHGGSHNPGELDFLFDRMGDDGSFPETLDFIEYLEKDRIFAMYKLTIDRSLTYPELIKSFVAQLAKEGSALAINIHRNFHRIPYIFPDAKYVHLLRDPRDVALSSIHMGWAGNVFLGVDHWMDTENSWDKLKATLTPNQTLTLHYELLVTEPEDNLKRLCDFMGLTYSPQMLEYPSHSTYKKPDKSLIQQWRNKLSERDVQQVESKAKDLMRDRGYRLSTDKLLKVNVVDRRKLTLQNKLYRMLFDLKRYGAKLYFAEKISRDLKFWKLNKKYVLEKNKIDTKFLK